MKKKEIIYIIPKNYLDILTPYINSINILKEEGYKIYLFSKYIQNDSNRISDNFFENLEYHIIPTPKLFDVLKKYRTNSKGKSTKWLLGKFIFILEIINIWCTAYFIRKIIKKKKNIISIATDPTSLYASSRLRKRGIPFIYFPQELTHSSNLNNSFEKLQKYIERRYNKYAIVTSEFDKQRAKLVSDDNKISCSSIIIMPNSIPGPVIQNNSGFLRKKFNIPSDKKIVLYTGGIASYNYTFDFIQNIDSWPENAILVMHCWGSSSDIDLLDKAVLESKRDIYISKERLNYYQIQMLYSSADIGLALYGNENLNHQYTGLSSGKMFNFLKSGVPVITNKTEVLMESVENNDCGLCIDDVKETGITVAKILSDINKYKSGCKNAYFQFEFTENHKQLIRIIDKE